MELLIDSPLNQRLDPGPRRGLNKGKSAQVCDVNLVIYQRLDHRSIVGWDGQLRRQAGLLLPVRQQRLILTQSLTRVRRWNHADAQPGLRGRFRVAAAHKCQGENRGTQSKPTPAPT